MARPRRKQRPLVEGAAERAAPPGTREAHDEETPEEARLGDFLIALVGRHLRDTMDPMTPGMERYWEWKAQQARDALTPQERVELAQRAREFAKRIKAEYEARQRAEADGGPTPHPEPDID